MPVVRQPVGERRAVVEDELVAAVAARVALVDAGLEGAVVGPEGEDGALEHGEPWRGGDAVGRVGGVGGEPTGNESGHIDEGVGHSRLLAVGRSSAC